MRMGQSLSLGGTLEGSVVDDGRLLQPLTGVYGGVQDVESSQTRLVGQN